MGLKSAEALRSNEMTLRIKVEMEINVMALARIAIIVWTLMH